MTTDNTTNNEEAKGTDNTEKKVSKKFSGLPKLKYDQIVEEAKEILKKDVLENSVQFFNSRYHNGLERLVSDVTEYPPIIIENYDEFSYALKACWYCLHLNSNTFSGITAVYAIKIGKIFDSIQSVYKEKDKDFKAFIKEQNYSQRSVQRYIRLAKSPGIEDYSFFGIERLDFMLSAMERSDYRGTIKDFISTFGIDFDPLEDKIKSVNDFKIDVSTAILKYLNEKENWGIVDIKLLEKYAKNKKGSIDYRTIQEGIETVQESGGTPEKYFILMLKGGSEAKRFKLLIQNTSNAMDDILNNVDTLISSNKSIDMIGANKIDVLIEKLNTLKEGVQITQET